MNHILCYPRRLLSGREYNCHIGKKGAVQLPNWPPENISPCIRTDTLRVLLPHHIVLTYWLKLRLQVRLYFRLNRRRGIKSLCRRYDSVTKRSLFQYTQFTTLCSELLTTAGLFRGFFYPRRPYSLYISVLQATAHLFTTAVL